MSRPRRALAALALCAALGVPRAADAADLVLICYLYQSGGGGMPVRFTRRVEVDSKAGTVAIADQLGNGFRPLNAYGKLVSADDAAIVFDYASPQSRGRATIDRRDGRYTYTDGRIVTEGTCSPSQL